MNVVPEEVKMAEGLMVEELNQAVEEKKPTKAELQEMHRQEQQSKKELILIKKNMQEETEMFELEAQRMQAEMYHHKVRTDYKDYLQARYEEAQAEKAAKEAAAKPKSNLVMPAGVKLEKV